MNVVVADDLNTSLPSGPKMESADETTVNTTPEGGFGVQIQKLWLTLDPSGPTRGAVLSAVLYIFLTWAVVPDVSSGVTYYFYTGNTAAGGLAFGEVTYSMLSVVGDIAMLGAYFMYVSL